MVLDWLVSIQAVVVVALVATVGYVWHLEGRRRWRQSLSSRFIYGVPWGSLITVAGVLAFYLFAQDGLGDWGEPVMLPFVNWAYLYPKGILVSGFAHASPAHLLGNLAATVILAPLAEYAWGHYPTERPGTQTHDEARSSAETDSTDETETTDEAVTTPASDGGLLAQPWIRAAVVFPAVVFVLSLLTSLYALGWSLGFSGTVFVFLGFVLVSYPITTVVAMVGLTGLNVLVATLQNPVLRATADPGAPGPPSWAGINVQAHILGLLIGVLLGLAVLWYRNERPDVERLFLATLLVVLARQLWGLATSSGDSYVQYRGIGVVFVLLLTFVITALVAVDHRPLPSPFDILARIFAYGWSVLVALGLGVVVAGLLGIALLGWSGLPVLLAVLAVLPLLGLPALVIVLADQLTDSSPTLRHAILALFVVIMVVIALPSAVGNSLGIADDPVPGDAAVTIGDYQVTYAENASHGRVNSTDSGLIVVSEQRYVWSVATTDRKLAHDGNATVRVGDIGWQAAVEAERTGWTVTGNDTVYAVDLESDSQQVRAFTSPPAATDVRLDGRTITLAVTAETFLVNVSQDGSVVDSAPIPSVNETVAVDGLQFTAEQRGGTVALFVTKDDTRVLLAEKETFD